MSVRLPRGFRVAGVHAGIKRNPQKQDLSLLVSELPCAAAGVYTSNLVFAAPVAYDRARTPGTGFRAVVINSGNANACTGARGEADCRRTADVASAALGCPADAVLVLSTGVIGVYLPIERVAAGIAAAVPQLGTSAEHIVAAGRGFLTTDTVHKFAHREITLAGRTMQVAGFAKGAAMIAPRMGTMLAIILTDAPLAPSQAQALLSGVVDDTFNCISVDGHMSTNDTVLFLANGAAGGEPLGSADEATFAEALQQVCAELARAIPADGEGCTHLVTIDVVGAADRESAYRIAKSVAESPLVKTAIAGGDPNWGRIVSAVGYAGVPLDPAGIRLVLNGVPLYELGSPLEFDEAAVSASLKGNRETSIRLELTGGETSLRFWSTDLTAEYVRLNADYRT